MKWNQRNKERRISALEIKGRLYRRRYLVPNAVTLGNMFCGFLTTIYAASGRFEKAVIATGIAILLDGLDGRVARRLNATSRFGVEFDSFSDLVSFGVAPALLMYHWCFVAKADEFGVFIAFVYMLCAAARLARFNISEPNVKGFMGLPTPGAAGVIVAWVNFSPDLAPSFIFTATGTLMMLLLSYLMVSNIEFFSIKQMRIRGLRIFAQIMLGALIALIWYNNGIGLMVLAFGYCLSGPIIAMRKKHAAKNAQRQEPVQLQQAK